jgi:hypothetical protein
VLDGVNIHEGTDLEELGQAIAMLNYIASKGYRCYGCRTSFETGFRFGVSACVFLF